MSTPLTVLLHRQKTVGIKKKCGSNQLVKLMIGLSNGLFKLFGLELHPIHTGKGVCRTLIGMNGPMSDGRFENAPKRKNMYNIAFHHQKLTDRLVLFYHRSRYIRFRQGQVSEQQLLQLLQQRLGNTFDTSQSWFADLLA